jgi:hypothetical protein
MLCEMKHSRGSEYPAQTGLVHLAELEEAIAQLNSTFISTGVKRPFQVYAGEKR